MASIPSEIFYNNCLKINQNHCFQVKHEKINSIKIEDSVMAGLSRYPNTWKNLFGNRFINLGISGDRAENVFLTCYRFTAYPVIPKCCYTLWYN